MNMRDLSGVPILGNKPIYPWIITLDPAEIKKSRPFPCLSCLNHNIFIDMPIFLFEHELNIEIGLRCPFCGRVDTFIIDYPEGERDTLNEFMDNFIYKAPSLSWTNVIAGPGPGPGL